MCLILLYIFAINSLNISYQQIINYNDYNQSFSLTKACQIAQICTSQKAISKNKTKTKFVFPPSQLEVNSQSFCYSEQAYVVRFASYLNTQLHVDIQSETLLYKEYPSVPFGIASLFRVVLSIEILLRLVYWWRILALTLAENLEFFTPLTMTHKKHFEMSDSCFPDFVTSSLTFTFPVLVFQKRKTSNNNCQGKYNQSIKLHTQLKTNTQTEKISKIKY